MIESLLSHSLLFFDPLLNHVVSTLHFQFPVIFFSFTILIQKDLEVKKKRRKKERDESTSKRIEETKTDRAKNEVKPMFFLMIFLSF